MKFTVSALVVVLAPLVLAYPAEVNHFTKRASSTDKADIGYATLGGGTTGGSTGTKVVVKTLADFKTAVNDVVPRIVIVDGIITGNEVVRVKSNKSILGANSNSGFTGVGLKISNYNNVIIRNLKITKVLAGAGDAIGIQNATNVWVDHTELSSDMTHDIDYYDGLLDITHGSKYISVTWNILRDHWKTSLIGHSDDNASEDTSILVTYYGNYWKNLDARGPSIRFGKAHIYANYYSNVRSAVNTRMGAQVLVENNVFEGSAKPIVAELSPSPGYAVARGNDFGGASNTAPAGTLTSVPYSYSLPATANVKALVTAGAGAYLAFS